MRNMLFILAIALVSCGVPSPNNLDCSEMNGTYQVSFTTISGNCGDIETSYVHYSNGLSTSILASTCIIDYYDEYDSCESEVGWHCYDSDGSYYDMSLDIQQMDDGYYIGYERITMLMSDGSFFCSGSYKVRYSKV